LSYYNELETLAAKNIKEKLVLPVYKIDNELTVKALSEFSTFKLTIDKLLDSNVDLEILIEQVNHLLPGVFTDGEIRGIKNLDRVQLFSRLSIELDRVLNRGILSSDISSNSNGSGLISLMSIDGENRWIETISAISVMKIVTLSNYSNSPMDLYLDKLLKSFSIVNCFYDNEQTKYNRDQSIKEIDPVIDLYRKGNLLVKKGFVVSNEDFKKINQAEQSAKKDVLSNTILVIGYLFLLYISSFILFSESFIQKKLKESDVILLIGITFIYIVTAVLIRYFTFSNFAYLFPIIIPTMLISMLITFLLGNRVGLYLSILFSFLILLVSQFSIYAFLVTLIMSVLGTVIVHDVEKRIDLLKSSGKLALLQIIVLMFMLSVDLIKVPDLFFFIIISVFSSLLSGVLILAFLPLLEHFLKISTCFQLAELCDLNAPLLKSMLIKAPGTYAHSIAVANMAESAAQHIGANPLLAKAGGYYHDIGKINQPDYFIENQKGGKNPHDDMKPSLSVAVIKSHVKLGIEKGRNIGLPGDIIDIIEQHHGKGKILYFLDKAKKDSKIGNVLGENFSYSGPNPQSPEAAIVMLADSVEAAVRSLKNPTISQLDKFVWDLMFNKLNDGMLDACGLTLSDMTTIKNAFINTLMGYYHSRIEYPSGEGE